MRESWQGFIGRFESFAVLAPHERQIVIEASARGRRAHGAGEAITPKGRLLYAGWVGHERVLGGGGRQILQLAVVGDPLILGPRSDGHTFIALKNCQTVDGTLLLKAAGDPIRNPGLAAALQGMREEAQYFAWEQILRLGRMSAIERVASFLLEIAYRHRAVESSFEMPLTQTMLADLLGLSVVHVNRTLQELRRLALIAVDRRSVTLLDVSELERLASFREPRPRDHVAAPAGVSGSVLY